MADREILYIPTASKSHQGTYTLTLIDDFGTAKIQVNLIVDERLPPKPINPSRIIVKHDMDVELDVGQNANLICQLGQREYFSNVISFTSWIRGNKIQRERFPSNIRPNQERLKIINVKPSDAGKYTCILSSSDGSSQTAVVNLIVQNGDQPQNVPPAVQLNTREKSVYSGESFELKCTISGYPIPSVSWLFNNDKIDRFQNLIAQENVLYIRGATTDLNGYFTCRAIGQDGRYAEDSANVRVLERQTEAPKQLSVDISPRALNPSSGENAQFECLVSDGLSQNELKFTWLRQEGALPSDSFANGPILALYDLEAQDSGTYICQVNNLNNGATGIAYSVLSVQEDKQPVVVPTEPLRVQVTPKELSIKQGRDGELHCSVTGGPIGISIKWKKTGESLDPVRHVVQGNTLRIHNAKLMDRGYYECEAESGDYYARDYSLIEIEPRELPRVELYPDQEQIELDYQGTIYVQCRVLAGTPIPSLEWRRADRKPLSSGAVSLQDGTLLQITNAGSEEFGEYECVARNEEGEAIARISLIPKGTPPTQSQPETTPFYQTVSTIPDVIIEPKRLQFNEGETATLSCSTSSKYPVRFAWFNPENNYIGGDENGDVKIENIRKSLSGYYTCKVLSSYGESTDRVFVDVVESEPAQVRVQVRPKSKTVSIGSNAEFSCNYKTDDDQSLDSVIVRWSKSGNQELPDNHVVHDNTLYIYNAKPSDIGTYLCTVQASYGRISFDAAYLQVSRIDSDSAFPIYIRVLETPEDSYQPTLGFRYGIKISVECVAQADDIEDISWTKSEGVSRAKTQRYGNTNTLVIPALVPMDLGTYVCIAVRRNGDRAQNNIVFSRVADEGSQFTYYIKGLTEEMITERPVMTVTTQSPNNIDASVKILGNRTQNYRKGDNAVIECEAHGVNSVEFVKHGEQLPERNHLQILGNTHRLSLHNLKPSDSGYYLCNAVSDTASLRDYIFLDVAESEIEQLKPLVFIKTLTNGAPIRVGEDLRLVCIVNDPDASVYFKGENEDITNELSEVESTDDSVRHVITLSPFKTENVGLYRCFAQNNYGESQDIAHITANEDETYSFKTGS